MTHTVTAVNLKQKAVTHPDHGPTECARKDFTDSEYLVIGIEEGDGNRTGTAKNLTCKDEATGQIFNSNIKGTHEYLAEILENKDYYIGQQATIKYFELTPDGIPRFPYAIAFRDYE